jgi:hypothetical protein
MKLTNFRIAMIVLGIAAVFGVGIGIIAYWYNEIRPASAVWRSTEERGKWQGAPNEPRGNFPDGVDSHLQYECATCGICLHAGTWKERYQFYAIRAPEYLGDQVYHYTNGADALFDFGELRHRGARAELCSELTFAVAYEEIRHPGEAPGEFGDHECHRYPKLVRGRMKADFVDGPQGKGLLWRFVEGPTPGESIGCRCAADQR